MKKVFRFLLLILLVLVAIVVTRAVLFPSQQKSFPPTTFALDKAPILKRFTQALQLRTISFENANDWKPQPFLDFHQHLIHSYPNAHKVMERTVINKYSLLYKWQGSDPKQPPIGVIAHIDVVPVEPNTRNQWKQPPFSGNMDKKYIWGRGTLDDKNNVMSLMEAVEYLARRGFQPQRTIYLGFGHDEEIGGTQGAAFIAKHMKQKGIQLEFLLDEGLAITRGIFKQVNQPIAMVGIAEKGYVTFQLSIKHSGGHSSIPPRHTAVGLMSTALHQLEANPFPAKLTQMTHHLFEYTGPEMSFPLRLVFANLWLFAPVVKGILSRKDSTNATLRTTTAVTMFRGGVKENVLPSQASAVVNFRILPGTTVKDVFTHVKRTIDNPNIHIETREAVEPSRVSRVDSTGFQAIQKTVHQIFPKYLVAPFLVLGSTDTKHFTEVTRDTYRFSPFSVTSTDLKRIHGTNERIAVSEYLDSIRFYIQLFQNVQSKAAFDPQAAPSLRQKLPKTTSPSTSQPTTQLHSR